MTTVSMPRGRTLRPQSWIGVGSVLVLIIAGVIWQIFAGLTFVIPTPIETFEVLIRNLQDETYLRHMRATAVAILQAFAIGVTIGGGLGLLIGLSPLARRALEPLVIALNGVPKIVLYPILLPIFQLGGSKIVMGALFAIFPVLINVSTGVREIPAVYWKLSRSLQANRFQVLFSIILPAIRKPFLTGLRLAVSLSVVGVVLAEFFATRWGLGRVVLQAHGHGDHASMVATILLLITVSFVVSVSLWRWEKNLR